MCKSFVLSTLIYFFFKLDFPLNATNTHSYAKRKKKSSFQDEKKILESGKISKLFLLSNVNENIENTSGTLESMIYLAALPSAIFRFRQWVKSECLIINALNTSYFLWHSFLSLPLFCKQIIKYIWIEIYILSFQFFIHC